MLRPGDTIDRYTVEALIGSGGTAVVYRVRHNTLGTRHALKVLSVTSEIIRDRMITEGRVQAALQHVNVVAVSDVLSVEEAPALVMEMIEGPSLDQALDKYRIGPASAENLFLGILAGVRQAHLAGLVHRDLKPANVLLARTNQGFVPKVTDFGLAKVLEDAEAGKGHTRAGVALGTPAYMAPEQVRDARTVDQRADLFALGCILYELMTGRRGFPGDDTIAIYNNILDGRYVPPRHWVPDLEDRLDNAVRGCLIVDRDARIPDTDTLLEVVQGERTWEIPPQPDEHELELTLADLERSGDSDGDAPEMPVALSRPGLGSITAPDPSRSSDPLWKSIHDPDDDVRGGLPLGPRPEQPSDPSEEVTEPEPAPSRSGWVFLGGASLVFLFALAVAVVGTLVILMGDWRGDEPSLSSTLPRTDEPATAPAEPAPAAVAEVEPDEVGAAEPSDDPGDAASSDAAVPSGDAAAREPAPAPAVQPAAPPPPSELTVKILSSPPTADLRIDGEDRGRTPAKLELAPGRYTVEVRSGDRERRFAIQVGPGRDNKWCYGFDDEQVVAGSCP